jgi:hypothetical protein
MIPKLRMMRSKNKRTQHHAGSQRLVLGFAAAILTALTSAAVPADASARAPLIGPVSANAGFYGEGVIETQIDPEGYETTYKISADCEVPAQCQHTEGTLLADNDEHPIRLKLAGLKPGITYHFDIHAVSDAGDMDWPGEFTAPVSPPGACPTGCSSTEENTSEIPQRSTELANAESNQTVLEYEAKQRQLAKEHEEAKAREAARLADEEVELKQAEELQAQEAIVRERKEREAEHPACRVPALKGEMLATARHALVKAHCRLGAVHRAGRHDGALYITAQGSPAGKRLAHNARVALWLGTRQSGRSRRAIAVARPLAASTTSATTAKTCSHDVTAVIGGKQKCLGPGEYCAMRYESQYIHYDFECVGSPSRLRRRR